MPADLRRRTRGPPPDSCRAAAAAGSRRAAPWRRGGHDRHRGADTFTDPAGAEGGATDQVSRGSL